MAVIKFAKKYFNNIDRLSMEPIEPIKHFIE